MMEVVECIDCGMQIFGKADEDKMCGKCEENETLKALNRELISLNLWSARRLHKLHKEFAYNELDKITGERHERV